MYAQLSTPGASLRLSWEGTVATPHPALGVSAHEALDGVPVWLLMAAAIALLILGLGVLLLLGRRRSSRRAVR
jgi:hypothetical protein